MRGFTLPIVLFALLAYAGQAHAQYVNSHTYLHSSAFDTTPLNDGGPGALSATLTAGGSLSDGTHFTSDVTASANATAQGGHLDLDFSMTTVVNTPAPNQISAFVLGRGEIADAFTIQAGSSGLANGEPVQVELQVEIDGGVSLGGAASSGGSYYSFWVTDRATSGNQAELEYTSIPPGSYSVDPPRWYVTLDTAIGRRVIIDTFLRAQIGGQVYSAGAESTDRIWFNADVRIVQASGFEDIEIISEAGAPIEGLNRPPVAAISVTTGIPAHVGDPVALDGSGSSDPDGDDLSYEWTLLDTPAGSSATLTGADTVSPSFVPDELGSYQIQLIVDDEEGTESEPALLTLTVENQPPVAAFTILTPLPVHTGTPVEFDGSASFDPDGDDFVFAWMLMTFPEGSWASLTGGALTSFTPDLPGQYTGQLRVIDEFGGRSADVPFTVDAFNVGPTPNAGIDQVVELGEIVTLDGSGSSEPIPHSSALTCWATTSRAWSSRMPGAG
jgi:hypothetical protein